MRYLKGLPIGANVLIVTFNSKKDPTYGIIFKRPRF